MSRRPVFLALAALATVGCSGSRVSGNFLGIESNLRCVERDFIGHYSVSGSGHNLSFQCDVDRGNDRWARLYAFVKWEFGEETPTTVSGTDVRDFEQSSGMRTDGDPPAVFHHEITIQRLDAATGNVRGVAHAWSERSDFEFRFNGQVEVIREFPE